MELYKIWTKMSPCTAEFQIFLSKMICNVIIIALKPFKFMLYAVLWYDMIWRVIIYEIVCYVMRFQCNDMRLKCHANRLQCFDLVCVVKDMLEMTVHEWNWTNQIFASFQFVLMSQHLSFRARRLHLYCSYQQNQLHYFFYETDWEVL